jgi:hypothetical protein
MTSRHSTTSFVTSDVFLGFTGECGRRNVYGLHKKRLSRGVVPKYGVCRLVCPTKASVIARNLDKETNIPSLHHYPRIPP